MANSKVTGEFFPTLAAGQARLSELVNSHAAVRYWTDGLITNVHTGFYRGDGLLHVPDGAATWEMTSPPWASADSREITTSDDAPGRDEIYRVPAENTWYFERLLREDGELLSHNVHLGLCAGVSVYDTPTGPYPIVELVDFKTHFVRGFPRPDQLGMVHVENADASTVTGPPSATEIPTELADDIRAAAYVLERRAESVLYFREKGWEVGADHAPFTDHFLDSSVVARFLPTQPAAQVPDCATAALPRQGAPAITWKELAELRPQVPDLPQNLPKHTLMNARFTPLHLSPIRRIA